jgi:quercetin dioxygenase-like cupin family protein
MPPGFSMEERPFQHQGEEFGIVVEGRLEVHWNNRVHVLEPGDSIAYRSGFPHWYRNVGEGACKSIWVITPPSF